MFLVFVNSVIQLSNFSLQSFTVLWLNRILYQLNFSFKVYNLFVSIINYTLIIPWTILYKLLAKK